jgi:hypothetical protein
MDPSRSAAGRFLAGGLGGTAFGGSGDVDGAGGATRSGVATSTATEAAAGAEVTGFGAVT